MRIVILFGFLSILFACKPEKPESDLNGVEIYLTADSLKYSSQTDYSQINPVDIALNPVPLVKYSDMQAYDTSEHIIRLYVPYDSMNLPTIESNGLMFVVTVNKEPVYYGFFWSYASSMMCPGASIMVPHLPYGQWSENTIRIRFNNPDIQDPRMDYRIIDRFIEDDKIQIDTVYLICKDSNITD